MAPAAAVQAPEIQFAQRLASNEKRIRNRAVKKLRGYISLRTQKPAGGFSQEELLKIWKGLFYCMWMQDKLLLQEELADTISQLIHVIQNTEARHLFIQTFWQTMNREWNGLDRLRLDKYYMLRYNLCLDSVKCMCHACCFVSVLPPPPFPSLTTPFLHLLMREIVHPDSNAPSGIKFHFLDIFLEELAKVGAKELTADQNLKFIEPFCKFAAKTKDRPLMYAIARAIFEAIVDQSPFAIEDLMKELKTCSSDDELSEEELDNKEKTKHLARKSLLDEEEEDTSENADYDIGPVLQFDYKAVADLVFEYASKKNTPTCNRKRLYRLTFCSTGIFPQDIPEDVSTDEDEDDDTFRRRKRKKKVAKPLEKTRLEEEKGRGQRKDEKDKLSGNGERTGLQKKRKRRKRKNNQSADSDIADGCSEEGLVGAGEPIELNQDSELENVQKKRKKKSVAKETDDPGPAVTPIGGNGTSSPQESPPSLLQSKKKCLKKKNAKLQKLPTESVHQNGLADASAQGNSGLCAPVSCAPKIAKKKQKVESGLVNSNGLFQQKPPERESVLNNLTGEGDSESAPAKKIKLKKQQKLISLEAFRASSQKTTNLKKKRKLKVVLSSVEANGVLEAAGKKSKKTGISSCLPLKKKKAKVGTDFVKFEKAALPRPMFFRKAKGSISPTKTAMQVNKLQASNSKKVTFGLSKNMTAEFKKTDKSILVSPEGAARVAFNPEQKPPHGVLKSPGTLAGTPQVKKPFVTPTRKRPTAMDFF
uniref:RRP1B protein n=1 Tax=Sphenodon punctatus TaxID=8508 RepID=A0A8D0GDM1_SPHPU